MNVPRNVTWPIDSVIVAFKSVQGTATAQVKFLGNLYDLRIAAWLVLMGWPRRMAINLIVLVACSRLPVRHDWSVGVLGTPLKWMNCRQQLGREKIDTSCWKTAAEGGSSFPALPNRVKMGEPRPHSWTTLKLRKIDGTSLRC
jgi:hypothetical protein